MRKWENQNRIKLCQRHRNLFTLSKPDTTTVEFLQSIFSFVFFNLCCQMQQNGHPLLSQNRYTKVVRKQPYLNSVDKMQKMFNSSVRKGREGGPEHFIQLPCYKSYCCKNIFLMSFKVLIWLLLTWFILLDVLRIPSIFVSFRYNEMLIFAEPKSYWKRIENIRTNPMEKSFRFFSFSAFVSFFLRTVLRAVECDTVLGSN